MLTPFDLNIDKISLKCTCNVWPFEVNLDGCIEFKNFLNKNIKKMILCAVRLGRRLSLCVVCIERVNNRGT